MWHDIPLPEKALRGNRCDIMSSLQAQSVLSGETGVTCFLLPAKRALLGNRYDMMTSVCTSLRENRCDMSSACKACTQQKQV